MKENSENIKQNPRNSLNEMNCFSNISKNENNRNFIALNKDFYFKNDFKEMFKDKI